MDHRAAERVLAQAELVNDHAVIQRALQRLAADIGASLAAANPLVLCVMGGAVVFAGQLLPLLRFPLEFDFIHVTRYRNTTQGGAIHWKVLPQNAVAGRNLLILDDILDEGATLAAIRDRMLVEGAQAVYTAVLAEKRLPRAKPIAADFVGLEVPDRYVFGFGMDVEGYWRNLPEIHALGPGGTTI